MIWHSKMEGADLGSLGPPSAGTERLKRNLLLYNIQYLNDVNLVYWVW